MIVVKYLENNDHVLSQLVQQIPSGDNVIIKGRKADILGVDKVNEELYHINIAFKKKPKQNEKDSKKK
ncbi:hypothetical protein SAMN05192533_101264 [Mesobacillus persicus]|uniref:Uncharacterized protein n=1 Tax=Mesobacillus persicus TaxID=930146 RepID=A0A1H7W4H5_9BACI|nr:hypothetical protein [Mesobacillus persicus]SEM16391.1 hypothetical protein SAMN05192533_101264 [Mesobacillus persicus]